MVLPAPSAVNLTPIVEMDGRIVYGLQPKQMEAFRLTPLHRERGPYPRHIGYGGAAGGGKSHLARAVAVYAAFAWPGSTGVIFRETKDQVKKNHINKLFEEVPREINGRKVWDWNGTDLCATFYVPDPDDPSVVYQSRILFSYLRYDEDKFAHQGVEYDYMIFEEATHYEWGTVRWLTGNRLRATRPYCRPFVLYPSNPGNVGHAWYKRLFIDCRYDPALNEDPDDYAFVQALVDDNAILLDRDPQYVHELNTLPEPYRSWLRSGDFTAGLGLALTMLDRRIHIVEPFMPPPHWTVFAGFDWGYAHPFSFGLYCASEDGMVWKMETITGRHLLPDAIAQRCNGRLDAIGMPIHKVRYIAAGHDTWDVIRARGESTRTIAEQLQEQGWIQLERANVDRVQGLNNLRDYLAWERRGPGGEDDDPFLRFMDTEGNRRCFDQLETLPSDPDHPEDALKTEADEFGHGGDDMYDETRYALASRPPRPKSVALEQEAKAWDPEVLAYEADEGRRVRNRKRRPQEIIHPEFGRL